MRAAGAQVGAGTDAGKRLEVVDEVRLIIIAAVKGDLRPAHLLLHLFHLLHLLHTRTLQDAAEASDTGEALGVRPTSSWKRRAKCPELSPAAAATWLTWTHAASVAPAPSSGVCGGPESTRSASATAG
jgi:hypothetical protein